jgi:penicillin-binding protein 2
LFLHAKACGVVDKTGIDLPNERDGLYPNTEYYRKKLHILGSLAGYKANLSIGQGEVLTTPMQINTFYAAVARNGLWMQPHLLMSTMGRGRITREQVEPLHTHKLPWSASTMQIIHDALWAVCNAPGGTARAINVPGATSYGKTGSAENYMGKMTHAWFTGYIVTDKPEIVITVFMENAGGGGGVCAPVANKIFNYYIGNIERIKAPAPIPPQFRTEEDNQPAATVPPEIQPPDTPPETTTEAAPQ